MTAPKAGKYTQFAVRFPRNVFSFDDFNVPTKTTSKHTVSGMFSFVYLRRNPQENRAHKATELKYNNTASFCPFMDALRRLRRREGGAQICGRLIFTPLPHFRFQTINSSNFNDIKILKVW
jgi:hypothetical protein